MKNEPKSYWLPDGRIIFAAQFNKLAGDKPNWWIAVRQDRGNHNTMTKFKGAGRIKGYFTESECQFDMRKYAESKGLKPAY